MSPDIEENIGQGQHDVKPVTLLQNPDRQSTHTEEPSVLVNLPSEQLRQTVCPESDGKVPFEQSEHLDILVEFPNEPGRHNGQDVNPETFEKVPIEHDQHIANEETLLNVPD